MKIVRYIRMVMLIRRKMYQKEDGLAPLLGHIEVDASTSF